MTPEQYQRVGQLYHAALDLPREKRSTFLDVACAGDDELRREVESLLRAHDDAGDFIASPAMNVAARLIVPDWERRGGRDAERPHRGL